MQVITLLAKFPVNPYLYSWVRMSFSFNNEKNVLLKLH